MNAYELADELENYVWMNPNNNRDYCKEVKDMLRQQADRITELEDRLSMYEIKDLDKPQIKELSDEEILQQAEWMFGTDFFESIDDPYWIEFARAILKKASEK